MPRTPLKNIRNDSHAAQLRRASGGAPPPILELIPRFLSKKMFAQAVHSTFRIHLVNNQIVQMKQIELREGIATRRQEQFAVLFLGPLDNRLNQGLYTFEHDAMGKFHLFIVPVGKKKDGFLYEAVFNRLVRE